MHCPGLQRALRVQSLQLQSSFSGSHTPSAGPSHMSTTPVELLLVSALEETEADVTDELDDAEEDEPDTVAPPAPPPPVSSPPHPSAAPAPTMATSAGIDDLAMACPFHRRAYL